MAVPDPIPPLFARPGLAWAADDRRTLRLVDGAVPPALGEWAELPSLELALVELTPLLRALELAGYVTDLVQLAVADTDGGPPDGWVVIFSAEMEVEERASPEVPVTWPEAGARVVLSLVIDPRRSAIAESLAMPASPLGPMPFGPFWNTEGENPLLFNSLQPVSTSTDLVAAVDASGIPAFVEQIVVGLADRWRNRAVYGQLDPFAAGSPPGLLWLFDPAFWDTQPPTWEDDQWVYIRDIALTVLGHIDGDPLTFLRGQIGDGDDDWAATLGGLLEAITDRGEARNSRRDYFRALESRFQWSLERELGHSVEEPSFHDVCGQRWLGYRSPVRWLELIMYMAEARLLPFPAVVHPELGYDFEFDEVNPVEVTRTADGAGVEIRILGSEPLVLKQEGFKKGDPPDAPESDPSEPVREAYDVEECFTWEYLGVGADETGIATLIVVAAPGVSVSGQENLAPGSCRLVVYRVQDHQAVPPWGEHIPTPPEAPYEEGALYWRHWALFEDGDPPGETGGSTPPEPEDPEDAEPAFRVHTLPLGVRISYPASAAQEDVEFTLDIQVDEGAADQRFTYEITPTSGTAGDRQSYAVVVRATEMVRIGVRHHPGSENVILDHYQRTTTIYAVDPPGVPISTDPLVNPWGVWAVPPGDPEFQRLLWEEYRQQWLQFLAPIGVDIGVGMIPIIGDAVDIDEFLFSFWTGEDKWGSPVTGLDRTVMFGGMLLPFVSNGAMRAVMDP